MAKVINNMTELIGNTPIMKLSRYCDEGNSIFAKLEYLNPAGSIKDRVALNMILDAEKRGILKPCSGATIIEPTSGNTGIGLAAVAAARGYKAILTMPDTMSVERQTMLKAYGAEIVLSPGAEGMAGAIRAAEELRDKINSEAKFKNQSDGQGSAVILGQFDNQANPEAHYLTTGPELYEQMDGKIDILVATAGTGGTISGIGRYLKERIPGIHIVAVEPAGSPVLSEGRAGAHRIQGIGAGFVPSTLDISIYDEVITVSDEDAFLEAKKFAYTEGIMVGISSGAALKAAMMIAQRDMLGCETSTLDDRRDKSQGLDFGRNIVVILPDSGDRYLSTELFMD